MELEGVFGRQTPRPLKGSRLVLLVQLQDVFVRLVERLSNFLLRLGGEFKLVEAVAETTPGEEGLQDPQYRVEKLPRLLVPVVLRNSVEEAVGLLGTNYSLVDDPGDVFTVLDDGVVCLYLVYCVVPFAC